MLHRTRSVGGQPMGVGRSITSRIEPGADDQRGSVDLPGGRSEKAGGMTDSGGTSRVDVELRRILSTTRGLRKLLRPVPGEPSHPAVSRLVPDGHLFALVPIPIPDVAGALFAGRLPGLRTGRAHLEIEALHDEGFTGLVCLASESDIVGIQGIHDYFSTARRVMGEGFFHAPSRDKRPPADDAAFEDALCWCDAHLTAGGKVFVHCVAGCGRSGTFASCLMVRHGVDPREAVAAYRRSRTCGPDTEEQIAYVIRYALRRAGGLAR